MSEFLLSQQHNILGHLLLGCLLLFACIETLRPARKLAHSLIRRWGQNISLFVFGNLLVRLLFPLLLVGWSLHVQASGWGLLGVLELSHPLKIFLAVVLLDLGVYLQHRLVHAVPWFWRFHRVHHSDLDYDVTTGLRFHPLEMLLTQLTKMFFVVLLGAPAEAVVIQEAMFIATTFFVHANFDLPGSIDKPLRWVFVTPSMHRIHHSCDFDESNRNFSNTFSIWDRLCGSYCATSRLPVEQMHIGLPDMASRQPGFGQLMLMPFRSLPQPPQTSRSATNEHA